MKAKKKEHHSPSRFTRGEKVTAKKHGRKAGQRKDEPAYGRLRIPAEPIPTA